MTTYEKFDEDKFEVQKKWNKKKNIEAKKLLIETLEYLSKSPMDKETYYGRIKKEWDKPYETVDWILRNLRDKKVVNVEGHEYVGLSQEMRDDIKKYGIKKIADTLIEEFGDTIVGDEPAKKWKKKYRNE